MNMPDTESGARPGDRSGSPTDHLPDHWLEQRARDLYREASQRIDPATAGRLRAARRQALEAAHKPAHQFNRWLIPTGAVAVIALATLMVWQPLPQGASAGSGRQAATAIDTGADIDNELPPDADKTDPMLYQNLDFYSWLAATDSHPTTR